MVQAFFSEDVDMNHFAVACITEIEDSIDFTLNCVACFGPALRRNAFHSFQNQIWFSTVNVSFLRMSLVLM